jgi:hypothetical protein
VHASALLLLHRTILVQHIEDIDSIIRLVKHIRYKWIDRHAFRQLMMATLGSRVISPAHIDFLWQAYDRCDHTCTAGYSISCGRNCSTLCSTFCRH